MKYLLSPEAAIDTFIKSKKENKDVPENVLESLRNYKKWGQNSLTGLLNASAYFPERRWKRISTNYLQNSKSLKSINNFDRNHSL